jgi:tetratricopeptide (TPR) repeat protein
MTEREQIVQQQERLAIHRRTLADWCNQQAQFGLFTPPYVLHSIRATRVEIQRCKEALREWKTPVEDLPDDEESGDVQATPGPAVASATAVRTRLEALLDLMQIAEARAAVAVYQTGFEAACRWITILGSYKALHDLLQQLGDRYAVLARCCKNLSSDPTTWNDVEDNEPELYVKTDELLEFAGRAMFAAEITLWTPKLNRAQRDLRIALETNDADGFKNALRRLKEVIDRQLSRANTRLVGVAEALQLATLVRALRQISERLGQIGLDESALHRLDDFRQGVELLAGLNERLTHDVALHNAFQAFDDELRRIEGVLAYDFNELADAWQDLGPMMRAILDGNRTEWVARLSALSDELERAIATGDSLRVRRAFIRYRSQAISCFNRVDYDLRDLCAALQQIGAPLDRALRMVQ